MDDRMKEAVSLIENAHEGFMATLETDKPFVSAVSFIYEPPIFDQKFGQICLLLSELARHTQNFQKNPNISLLVMEKSAAPVFERKRVTVQGKIRYVKDAARLNALRESYKKEFPDSERLLTFADFRFFEIEISDMHYIAGFGGIHSFK